MKKKISHLMAVPEHGQDMTDTTSNAAIQILDRDTRASESALDILLSNSSIEITDLAKPACVET